jgi:uncharacterized protein YjhX (UPF0386 family)
MSIDLRTSIINEAEFLEDDCYYISQAHYVAARRWQRLHYLLGVPIALISGVVGASALSQFDQHAVVVGVLALAVAALSAITTFVNPSQRAVQHLAAGNTYEALRNVTRIFREVDCHTQKSNEALERILKRLNKKRDDLNRAGPLRGRKDLAIARQDIQTGSPRNP